MNEVYNLAVDIGTTNVVISLFSYNTETGEEIIIDNISQSNSQKIYGKDIITRITNSRKEEVSIDLHRIIVDQLQMMMEALLIEHNLKCNDIKKIAVVGNTTMLSIILNYDIKSLGQYPFTIYHKDSKIWDAQDIFEIFNDTKTQLIILGCVSAFIGADILAGYMFINSKSGNTDKYRIMIDLGTNGEVVLWNDQMIFADSAPCGPVFEKCLKSQNFFGTNLIDAISMGVKSKKINRDGTLIPELFDTGITLYNINLTMDTIRETQLGLASIFATIMSLIIEADICFSDIEEVYVSGCFGSNLNIDNSIEIGLFPEDFKNKVIMYENTALLGARMACVDETFASRMDRVIDRIKVIQNAGNLTFQNEYLKSLNFNKR